MRYKEKKKEKHLTVLKPEKNHTSVLLTLVTIPWVVAAYAIYELQKKDSEIVDLKKTLKNLKNQISNKEEEIQTLKLQNEFLEVKKKSY